MQLAISRTDVALHAAIFQAMPVLGGNNRRINRIHVLLPEGNEEYDWRRLIQRSLAKLSRAREKCRGEAITSAVVREPACAGRFYPANAEELRAVVQGYVQAGQSFQSIGASETPPSETPPKAIIAPHAGYVYSGPIAGVAYAVLRKLRGQVKRVVLLGPSHFVRVVGLAVPSSNTFLTPLGRVPIDRQAVERALTLPQVVINDAAHAREHKI